MGEEERWKIEAHEPLQRASTENDPSELDRRVRAALQRFGGPTEGERD